MASSVVPRSFGRTTGVQVNHLLAAVIISCAILVVHSSASSSSSSSSSSPSPTGASSSSSSSTSSRYERTGPSVASARGHGGRDPDRGHDHHRGHDPADGSAKDERSRSRRRSSLSWAYPGADAYLGESAASTSSSSSGRSRHYQEQQHQSRGGRGSGRSRSTEPNIVVILTDDQDVLLGSLKYMPKLQKLLIQQGATLNNSFVSTPMCCPSRSTFLSQKLLIQQGATLNNSFVSTPMCCPSRSTFLSGMYVHNHNVYTNNANCSGAEWQAKHEPRAFPNYVNSTYRTGYFGKYLNDYFGDHTPPGWHRWMGLIRNSRFYNYSLVDENGRLEKHGDNYYQDYLTDLIARRGTDWLRESKRTRPTEPVMMVLSVPAPHGPEDAAPQYQHMFENNTDHRTPAWNHAPNPDKQWLLQHKSTMTPQFKIFTDLLQRRRLQTLQSVDDLVENVVTELDQLGELDNTYILYTSDHGYHLGRFNLICYFKQCCQKKN
ncbi:hypothetical protein EGW08_004186 [Elysia chlorotica]|uniref:Sulfatase N-terminal domain-containing protein n=1 Tax=Elysia chlorotica TaxID=188477 RepID=A0A433U2J2_ELYCH|nr:hypothetical protein EGW08_004186 [Elysia chlorotica]